MPERVQVLLIEDDPDTAYLMSLHLSDACGSQLQFTMESAGSLAGGLDLLKREEFDVVLLDLMLPDSQGLDTLQQARAQAGDRPIVVLTGMNDEALGLKAIGAGAQDFLVKEKLDPRLLRRALGFSLERARLHRQLENLIQSAADAMLVVCGGTVRFANPAAEALLGRKRGELVGKPFEHPLDPARAREIPLPSTAGERVGEMRVARIDWRGEPASLASVRDITDLRRLEEIKAEVRERRRLDKLKDQFVSAVSHELRSPLTVVKAAIANLHDGLAGPLSEDQSQQVYLARRNIERLARIINNLLDLSRLESGRAELSLKRADPRALIEEAVQGARVADREGRVEFKLKLPPRLPPVSADPDMLAQVLTNLLDNAQRFARREVTVTAKATAEGAVEVCVADDGPGIPPDRLGDLFNKFVQVNRPSGGGGYKGTGLGLAICHEILKAHDGRIWAESGDGRGARLRFVVPAWREGAAPAAGKAGPSYEKTADH